MKFFSLFIVSLLMFTKGFSQKITAIDNKGTIKEVTNSRVFEGASTPANPEIGDIWVNSTANESKIYNGSSWVNLFNTQITSQTINLYHHPSSTPYYDLRYIYLSSTSLFTRTIPVTDASKIVGFTLISTNTSLSDNGASGRMTNTWMIGDNRDKIVCYMKMIDLNPSPTVNDAIKLVTLSVEIQNDNNKIKISNYNSRHWFTNANAFPASLQTSTPNRYKLDKLVIYCKQ